MSERCRAWHAALRLRCERDVRHPGSHRAETGEAPYRLGDVTATTTLPFFSDWLSATDRAMHLFSLSPNSDARAHVPLFVSRSDALRSRSATVIASEHGGATFRGVRAGTSGRRGIPGSARAAPA